MSSKHYKFTTKKKTTNTQQNHNKNNNTNNIHTQKHLPRIRVCVRKRPANKKECQNGDIDIIEIKNTHSLTVKELK
jgi:hypothetical protein